MYSTWNGDHKPKLGLYNNFAINYTKDPKTILNNFLNHLNKFIIEVKIHFESIDNNDNNRFEILRIFTFVEFLNYIPDPFLKEVVKYTPMYIRYIENPSIELQILAAICIQKQSMTDSLLMNTILKFKIH